MNKKLCAILVVILCLQFPSQANAWVLFKTDNIASHISKIAGDVKAAINDQLNHLKNLEIVKAIGKGFEETKEFMKTMKQNVTPFADGVKATIKAAENVKGQYAEKVGQVRKINRDIADLKKKKKRLLDQASDEEKRIASEVRSQQNVINGKISNIDENIRIMSRAVEQEPDETKKKSLNSQVDTMQQEKTRYLQEKNELNKKIKSKRKFLDKSRIEDVKDIDASLKRLMEDLKVLLNHSDSIDDPEQALILMRNRYFLRENEKDNPAKSYAIHVNRRLEHKLNMVNAYRNSILAMSNLEGINADVEDQSASGDTFDTSLGAYGMEVQLKLRRLEAFSRYARVLIDDLKIITANELSKLNYTKLKKSQKPISEFNLDDYILEFRIKSSQGEKL